MPKTKCLSMIQMREMLQAEPEKEVQFLEELPVALHELYKTALTNTWAPIELVPDIYTIGAKVLYPDDPDPIVHLGYVVSKKTYTGIYAFFIRIPTVEFILKRLTNLWFLFHDVGQFGYEKYTGDAIDLYAREYPELSLPVRKMISGNILAILSLLGLKLSAIQMIDDDPNNWRWHIEFENPNKK
jgi:hypothetical protein